MHKMFNFNNNCLFDVLHLREKKNYNSATVLISTFQNSSKILTIFFHLIHLVISSHTTSKLSSGFFGVSTQKEDVNNNNW